MSIKFPPKTTDFAFLGSIFFFSPNVKANAVSVCNQITSILQITIPGLWVTALNVYSIACFFFSNNNKKKR